MGTRSRVLAAASMLALPLAGLLVLLQVPRIDVRWEHHPSHFWLVLAAGAVTAALAYATGDAAGRRNDARIYLVSLAFLAAAGFLFLHALATPGVLFDEANAGFAISTPIGLALAAALFGGSALAGRVASPAGLVRTMGHVRLALVVLLLAWAGASVAGLPPLDADPPLQRGSAGLIAIAALGVAGFATAAIVYAGAYLRRPSRLLASVAASSVLLAEAMVAVAFSRNWHASWWEWHVLMLVAFAIVAWSARTQWREEPFADLYLEPTVTGQRDVSVLFADLEGFTSFSEERDVREVTEMLNALLSVAVPAVVREHRGSVAQIAGDAIMVTFNQRGDQPDHAQRAARAAIALRDAVARLVGEHPDWPKLRIGVNTGEVAVGVIGTSGGRTYTVVGDAVNVASRLEKLAPTGGVVIGRDTLARVEGAQVESLRPVKVKGKNAPVEAFLLLDVSGSGR